MFTFILWYLNITILGLLAFPLVFRLLPGLSGHGYGLSRAFGLLLWGYLYWLLGSLGFLGNNLGGAFASLVMLAVLSAWTLRNGGWREVWGWLHRQRRLVVAVEVLFLLAFGGFTFIRAANPDLIGTEKPMELAFINAILRSPSLPPNDPWLSGYTISYYYFGYVLVSMLARLAATPTPVAFNLGVALIFGLSASAAYNIVYDLLHAGAAKEPRNDLNIEASHRRAALLGPFFILIVSNLGGFLNLLRWWGVFWRTNVNGQQVSKVWAWLDIGRYTQPPDGELFSHWWWWQASRIIQDFDFNWVNKGDIIDEFPFFSFLLADLHPHVLAMPFALLAIGLALNLFLGDRPGLTRWFGLRFRIHPFSFTLAAIVLGGLAFFNTWDFPFYVALYASAYALRTILGRDMQLEGRKSFGGILSEWIQLGFALGVSGAICYLPFYFGFQSQAGGPLPNLIYVTRGIYLWIHFMPLLIPILALLIFSWRNRQHDQRLKNGLGMAGGLILILSALTLVLTLIIVNLKGLARFAPEAASAADAFLRSMAGPDWVSLIAAGVVRRVTAPGTWLTLVVILVLGFALLWPRRPTESDSVYPLEIPYPPGNAFATLLILMGALLTLAPEFVFLRDLFGYRINTIFKFYFQVWLMWGIAAAFAVAVLWSQLKPGRRVLFQISISLVLALSLSYPLMGLWSKTDGFKPASGFTLDGTAYLERSSPDEAAAMTWLRQAPLGVVAEAIGGSYTQYARMSVNSGQPTVLGWEFHEMQWRGGTDEMGSRRVDIELMYCTKQWEEAQEILSRYQVRYVVVGATERAAYGPGSNSCPGGLNQAKFANHLTLVFEQGQTSIYQVPEVVE